MFVTGKTIPTLVPCHLPEFLWLGNQIDIDIDHRCLGMLPQENIVIPDNPSQFPIFGGLSS